MTQQKKRTQKGPATTRVIRDERKWGTLPMLHKKIGAPADTMTARCALETGLSGNLLAVDIIGHRDGSSSVCTYSISPGERLVDGDVVFRAKTLDKEWFRDHPHRSHRLRQAIPGEYPHAPAETWVVVRQTRPGLRLRRPFQALIGLPPEEAPEHIAHAMYDLLCEARDKPVFTDELFKRGRAYEVAPDPEDPSDEKPRYSH